MALKKSAREHSDALETGKSGFLSVKLSKNEFLGKQDVTNVCQNRPFYDLLLDLFFASVIK